MRLGDRARALPHDAVRYGAILLFSFGGGMVPGAVFAGIPVHAPRPALIGVVAGMVVQGTSLGNLLGPPVYAAAVGWLGGWEKGIVLLQGAAALVIVFALLLGRLERRR